MNDLKELPCRFAHHFSDMVPMPFGSGNCSMPGFECIYEGDVLIDDEMVCEENGKCPAYSPVNTFICKNHVPNTRYYDECPTCIEKQEKTHRQAEADREYW